MVDESLKDHAVLIHESKEAELIAVKLCNTYPEVVVVCYYGAQENTNSPATIASHISEVMNLIKRVSAEGSLVILAGDFNVSIGTRVLHDNHPFVSKGGRLFTDFLEEDDDLVLANTMYPGSCITHVDASGGAGKCLDFVVANAVARQRMSSFLVDETKIMTPYKYNVKSGSKTYSDHLSLFWEVKINIFYGKSLDPVYVWNYAKPLGDGKFAYHLDRAVGKLVKCSNNNDDINIVMKKVRQEEDNARHRGYGRREVNWKTWEYVEDERIELYRIEEVKKIVDKVKEDRKNHRVPLQVFACRKSHLMSERGETFSSILHPDTGAVVESREEIYEATIRHNQKTLSQNEDQSECYRQLTEFKLQYIEWAKLVESQDPKDDTLYLEEYLEVVKELQGRNKTCYADMKKWGPNFRIFVYWLLKRMYEREEVPDEFLQTNLQALYKKGSRMDLGNYRFLHLKTCLAKLFETLVMRKVKPDLWNKYPESQIGGCPASRTTEHLYTLLALMQEFENNSVEGVEGCIIIFKDVVKAFDKLSVKCTLFATAMAGVTGRNLRILEKLNKRTTFRIVGDPEKREFTKEYVGGQGTVFTCTACSLAMPDPMARNIREYEAETGEELGVRVGPSKVMVSEVDFVDDEGAVCKDAKAARVKGKLITRSMDEINVKVHPTKTRYMILGTDSYKRRMEEELAEDPIMIQGFAVERSYSEKYLGMMICAGGSKETVRTQMEFRVTECKKKLAVVKNLLDKPSMKELGYLAGVRTLFESVITSTALYSAGTWVGMTRKDSEWFDRECKGLWYTLLKLNSRTTWLQVCWECDLLPWSWGVVREKLNLVSFLHHGKVSQAGRVAVGESRGNVKYGLVEEARKWASKLNLPDPSVTQLSSDAISEAVRDAARMEMWESVVTSKYIRTPVLAERYVPDYFFYESWSNHDQLIWFAYRLGILEFRRRYSKKYNTTQCIYECEGKEDTFDHSLQCERNPVKLRGQHNLDMLGYLKELHEERLNTVGMGLYWL